MPTQTTAIDACAVLASNPELPHQGYGTVLNITIWLLAASSGIFLFLRIWCKLRRHRTLWWDDYILITSWVSLVLSCLLQSIATVLGFGMLYSDIDPRNLVLTRLLSLIAGFFLVLAAAWSKTSFAITVLRISDGWIRRFIYFVIITTNLAMAGSGTLQWVQCWPLEKLWLSKIPGTCLALATVNGYNMSSAAYSGAMDIILALLPWSIFWTLTMRRKEKLGTILAMGMGVFAGATSFFKILAIHALNQPRADQGNVIILMILGTSESAITIMAVSIPILRNLLSGDLQLPLTPMFLYATPGTISDKSRSRQFHP